MRTSQERHISTMFRGTHAVGLFSGPVSIGLRVLTSVLIVSIAGQFPFAQPGGVSSLAANEGNWCTVYP